MAARRGQSSLLPTFLLAVWLSSVFEARGGFLHTHAPAYRNGGSARVFHLVSLMARLAAGHLGNAFSGAIMYLDNISVSVEEGENGNSPCHTDNTLLLGKREDTFSMGCRSKLTSTKPCSPGSIHSN